MANNSTTIYIGSEKANEGQAQESIINEKLNELASRSNLIIYEISTRPFLLSPGSNLTICPNRVTIAKKGFFSMYEFPMAIENITNARVYTHFRKASLEFETFGIPKPDTIRGLRTDEARLARRYVLALIECKKNNIDLSGMNLESLREKLKDIGTVQYSTRPGYHNL